MYVPEVGEKLFVFTECSDYWVSSVHRPYTVDSVDGKVCVVREAKPVFIGDIYYDSLPDHIEDDANGEKLTLRWSEKKQRWQCPSAGGYSCPNVAVFGYWDYQPYLN